MLGVRRGSQVCSRGYRYKPFGVSRIRAKLVERAKGMP